jgi:hypothetical protein
MRPCVLSSSYALVEPRALRVSEGAMSLPNDFWPKLADDYVSAYKQAFPTAGGSAESLPSRNAILLAASVAQHETSNGMAWPGQNNFGAVQLRGLTLQERAAFDDGDLKPGDYNADRTGVLRVDTHPGPNGPIPYPEWFVAFDHRVDGIAYFLKTLWRLSGGEFARDGADPMSLSVAMYRHGYYEGAHHGARPVGQRNDPLTAPEQANVSDYAHAVTGCLATIAGALGSWDFGRDRVAGDDGVTSDPVAHDTEPVPPGDAA